MKQFGLIIKIVFCLSSCSVLASEEALQHFFENTKTLEAQFSQKISDEQGVLIEQSSGKFYLSRPGKFRWDYFNGAGGSIGPTGSSAFDNLTELSQQIIADGKAIYFYDPELEQVSVRDNKDALAQVPSLILVNSGSALHDFFLVEPMSMIDGLSWVSLKPKSEGASYQRLLLAFNSNQLSEILLFDMLGNETRLQLNNVVENEVLSDSTFEASFPEHTDVLVN